MISNDTTKQTSFDCLFKILFNYHNMTDNLPNAVEPTWVVFAVFNAIIAPPTTIINFLIIWTIVSDRELRNVTHNILLVALAVTDFFVGLILEPFFSWFLVALLKRRPVTCQYVIYIVPSIIVSCCMLNTLTLASADLYLAVEHTQFYMEHVTTKKVATGTVIFWISNIFLLMMSTFFLQSNERLKKIPSLLVLICNVVIILYCTIKVQITAHRQRQAIQAQVHAVQQENADEEHGRKQQYKHALTVVLIVLSTFLLYCPFIICTIIQLSHGL